MIKNNFNKKQKGQAMVETAIMLPLLVLLLLGVGYFGNIITTQHNLTVAARYAARAIALDSTKMIIDRTEGTFFARLDEKAFKELAMQSLPGFDARRLKAAPINLSQLAEIMSSVRVGKLIMMPEAKGYAYLYKVSGRANGLSNTIHKNGVPQLSGMEVGIGAVFFGVRLTYRLNELDWIAKFLFKRTGGVTIEAVSMMPAELPLRNMRGIGTEYGIMNLNEGLYKILRVNVRLDAEAKRYNYEDLIDE